LVGLVTITLSTYLILYSQDLYRRLAPWLRPFERRHPHRELAAEQHGAADGHPEVLVFGLGRYGRRLAERLQAADLRVLGVDFDPERANELARADLQVRFGDAQDPAFLASLPLAGARWAVSTLPDLDSNRALLHGLAEQRFGGEIAVVARDEAQGTELWQAGAPVVLYPFRDAVDFAAENLATILRHHRDSAGRDDPQPDPARMTEAGGAAAGARAPSAGRH
jgi:hypothetical protein